MERQAAAGRRTRALTPAGAAVRACLAAITEASDLSELLAEVLKAAVDRLCAGGGAIWLIEDGDTARLALTHDGRQVSAVPDVGTPSRIGSHLSHFATLIPDLRVDRIVVERLQAFEESSDPEEVGYANHLRSLGFQSVAFVPLFVGRTYQGVLTLRFRDDRHLSLEEEELACLLANQAALAIQVNRLAEAAITREREAAAAKARAEKFAVANALLRETSDRLGAVEDLDAFLGRILLTMHDIVGGHSASIWLIDPHDQRRFVLHHVIENGRVVPAARSSHVRRATGSSLAPGTRNDPRFQAPTAKPVQFDVSDPGHFDDDERAYLRRLGVRSLVWVPLALRERLLGTFTIRLADDRQVLEDDLDLIQALAGQAAVALELQRLAEAAREAALSEERAAAARKRTEALERTAETLRLSLDLLAAEPELERFLGHVLRAANTQLNVRRSTLWLHDHGLNVGRLHMACRDGRISVDPVNAQGQPILSPPRDDESWRRLIENRVPVAFDDAQNNPEISEIHDAMRALRVRTLLIVPMMLGAEILGTIGLYNTERENWTEDEINLAQALGHQATLALQLTRLAARAREGAILEERNRLAREIHDTLAQGFAAIRMQLELARGDPDLSARTVQALEFAHQVAGENLVEARRSMAVLKSARSSLGVSLSAAIEGVRRLGKTRVVAEVGAAPEPPPDVAHELLRIAQEAMLNAVRHSEASTLRITLAAVSGRGVQIAVADDGKGFDASEVRTGFGLAGLRERASAINAELAIVSEPGGGTEVIATWAPA